MSQIPIEKPVLDKDQYGRVIDTQFRYFANQQEAEEVPVFTLEDFFSLYEELFFQIPKEGDANSHRFILEKEAEYLGVIIDQTDIQALLDEITSLRQQVLETQTALNELSKLNRNNGR
jgi:hypothetical protein